MPSQESWKSYRQLVERWVPGAEHEQHAYIRIVGENVRPGMAWLDAGCGHQLVPEWMSGAEAIEKQLISQAALVVGCDIDRQSLVKPAKFRRIASGLVDLAFATGTFDIVTCNMVVEHLEDPGSVFRELFRVLRPNGIAILHTPNIYHWANTISRMTPYRFHKWAMTKFFGQPDPDVFPTLYRCNTARSMRKSLLGAGFADVQIRTLAGQPRLVGFGPLLYLECFLFRLARKFPALHETLCAIARKGGDTGP